MTYLGETVARLFWRWLQGRRVAVRNWSRSDCLCQAQRLDGEEADHLRRTRIRFEKIEAEIQRMSPEERAAFRAWFVEFDAADWDRQFEADVQTGKLDALADRALADHAAELTTKL